MVPEGDVWCEEQEITMLTEGEVMPSSREPCTSLLPV